MLEVVKLDVYVQQNIAKQDYAKLPESKVVFALCQSCFWCASELASSDDKCPLCGQIVYRQEISIEEREYNQQKL